MGSHQENENDSESSQPWSSSDVASLQESGHDAVQTQKQRIRAEKAAEELMEKFWVDINTEAADPNQFPIKAQELPLARIKKIMKLDDNVKMIASETPVLLAKACEIFIRELTARAFISAEESKRRTLQRNDIAAAITKYDQFDFLIDIVPREELNLKKKVPNDPPVRVTFPPGSISAPGSGSIIPGNTTIMGRLANGQEIAIPLSALQPSAGSDLSALLAGSVTSPSPSFQIISSGQNSALGINSGITSGAALPTLRISSDGQLISGMPTGQGQLIMRTATGQMTAMPGGIAPTTLTHSSTQQGQIPSVRQAGLVVHSSNSTSSSVEDDEERDS